MIIGIIGNGFVGKATYSIVNNKNNTVYIYDIDPLKSIPKNLNICKLRECDIIFICVPTPMKHSGECYLDIVKDVINQLNDIVDINFTSIVLRSTVPCGTSDYLNVSFMPEFLTEKNWKSDCYHCKNWIIGVNNDFVIEKIKTILKHAKKCNNILYDNLHICYNREAEIIKLFKNTFLATKVSFCNEIYTFCKFNKINYELIKDIVTLDERINYSHMNVPGHDNKLGFGGTCFPKDIRSLQFEMKKNNIKCPIIDAVIYRNNNIDRIDDELEIGRSII